MFFLDLDPERGIAAGERWERALNEAASRCEAVLFLVSRDWLASRWCLKEFNLARKLNKRLFGVLIEAIPVAELPDDLTGTWQVVDLAAGQDHVMLRVILPRTHEEAHVTFSKEGLTRLRNGLAKAGLDPSFFAWPPERDPDRPPYRGLKPLEAEDAGIFFGRDAPIVEALDTLRGLREGAAPRLLVILGASGAGKSSFLRAGLLAAARPRRPQFPAAAGHPPGARGDQRRDRLAARDRDGACGAGLPSREQAFATRSQAAPSDCARCSSSSSISLCRNACRRARCQAASRRARDRPSRGAVRSAKAAKEGRALLELIRDLAKDDRPGLHRAVHHPLGFLRPAGDRKIPRRPSPTDVAAIANAAGRLSDRDRRSGGAVEGDEPQAHNRAAADRSACLRISRRAAAATLCRCSPSRWSSSTSTTAAAARSSSRITRRSAASAGAIEAAVERALMAADNDYRIPRDRDARLALLRRGLIPWLAGIDPETGSPRRRVARLPTSRRRPSR